MKNYTRRPPVRARRNPPDCPLPIDVLPPSAIVVPVTQVLLGMLLSFLRDPQGVGMTQRGSTDYPKEYTRHLISGDPGKMSPLLLDPKALAAAAAAGFSYGRSNDPKQALTEITVTAAKQAFYALVGVPSGAEPPVYIAPVGDVETLYKLVNRRRDRDVFAPDRLPLALNALLAKGAPNTWGIALIVPNEIEVPAGKDQPPERLYESAVFKAKLTNVVISAGGKHVERDLLAKVRDLADRFVSTDNEKKDLDRAQAGDPEYAPRLAELKQMYNDRLKTRDEMGKAILNSCVYRIVTPKDPSGYVEPDIVALGYRDFLPGHFVSRFIDVAVAEYLLPATFATAMDKSRGKGVSREIARKMIHDYRRMHGLYTLPQLQKFVQEGEYLQAEGGDKMTLPDGHRSDLIARIEQAEEMLTAQQLAKLEKSDEGSSPRRQVNDLIRRMPSYFIANMFATDEKSLPTQQSNVVAVFYTHDWEARGLSVDTLDELLTIPKQITVSGPTLMDVARRLDEVKDRMEKAQERLIRRLDDAGQSDVFAKWVETSEVEPLTIYAVVLNTKTNLWPKPATGSLGRGAELHSAAGAEKNGKLVLFKNAHFDEVPDGKPERLLVAPAELSERDVNLIFANYMPFTVREVGAGMFNFVEGAEAPALTYETLSENTRVQSLAAKMRKTREEKAKAAAAKKAQRGGGGGGGGRGRRNPEAVAADADAFVEESPLVLRKAQGARVAAEAEGALSKEELLAAISMYLFEIAPAKKPYRRTPKEIQRRQTGARFARAAQVGAARGGTPDTFVPTRRLNVNEVASRLRDQASGWWANLTRIVYDNQAMRIAFTETDSEDVTRNMLDSAMALYGVAPARTSENDRTGAMISRIAALNELYVRLMTDAPQTDTLREAYKPARMRRVDRDRRHDDEEGQESPTEEDLAAPSETLIARLNPRRAPRPPRPARPPRGGLRRNPVSGDYADKVRAGFSREGDFRSEDPEEDVDYLETRRAFPDTFGGRSDVKPELAAERIAQYGQHVRFGRRPSLDEYTFGAPPPPGQGGLSLEEARAIHKRQVEAFDRRAKSSIPASSALCAVNRRQKLKGYRPPSALMQHGPPGFAQKKVVIWVSPASAAETRVMMYRRNTHIDCDFVASAGGMSLGQLLALALQDVLLWLAQRDARKLDTYVYVGRVGDPTIKLAWKPGDPLTYGVMLKNLGRDGETLSGYDAKADIERYKQASQISYVSQVTATQRAAQGRPAEMSEDEEEDEEIGLLPQGRPPEVPKQAGGRGAAGPSVDSAASGSEEPDLESEERTGDNPLEGLGWQF